MSPNYTLIILQKKNPQHFVTDLELTFSFYFTHPPAPNLLYPKVELPV